MKSSTIISDNPRNAARLQAALNQAQCRAKVRLLSVNRLREFAAEAERELAARGLPKRLRVGCTAQITPELPPLAYKYRAQASAAHMVRRAGGWALDYVYRTSVYPVQYGQVMGVTVTRSDAAIEREIQNDRQLANFVGRKVAAAERTAAEKAAAQVAAILDPSRLPLVSLGPTVVH